MNDPKKNLGLAIKTNSSIHLWHIPVDTFDEESQRSHQSRPPDYSYQPDETLKSLCTTIAWHPRTYNKLALLFRSPRPRILLQRFGPTLDLVTQSDCPLLQEDEEEEEANDETIVSLHRPTCMAFPQRSGRHLAVGYTGAMMRIHNVRAHHQIPFETKAATRFSFTSDPVCVTWAAADKVLVVGTGSGEWLFLSPNEPNDSPFILPPSNNPQTLHSACESVHTIGSDSYKVAAAFSSGLIWLCHVTPQSSRQDKLSASLLSQLHPDSSISCSMASVSLSSTRYSPQPRLISSGLPDLALRVWNLDTCHVLHCNRPVSLDVGYVAQDLGPDDQTLAVWLIDGRLIIYHLFENDLSTPFYQLSTVCGDPKVTQLAFQLCSSTSADTEEGVTFAHSLLGDTGGSHRRSPLTNLTNTDDSLRWNSVFHGISEIELTDLSESGFTRLSLGGDAEVVATKKVSGVDENHVSSPMTPTSTPLPPRALSAPQGTAIVTQTMLDDFRADMHRSHCDLLMHFSRLEHKMETLFHGLADSLKQMRRDHEALSLELERQSYFY